MTLPTLLAGAAAAKLGARSTSDWRDSPAAGGKEALGVWRVSPAAGGKEVLGGVGSVGGAAGAGKGGSSWISVSSGTKGGGRAFSLAMTFGSAVFGEAGLALSIAGTFGVPADEEAPCLGQSFGGA